MRKKLRTGFGLTLIGLIMLPTVALATSYESTLLVSPGSACLGALRKYDEDRHSITIRADELIAPGNAEFNKVVIEIGSKGLFGDFKQKARKVQSLVQGKTTTTEMGSVGKGKRWYRFGGHSHVGTDLGGEGDYYSGVRSDYVLMKSY